MKNTIVVDLDGTLSNSSAREHFAQQGMWDQFHGAIADDEPHMDVMQFIRDWLPMSVDIIIVTGRKERYRKVTNEWLMKYAITIDVLLMVPDDDFTQDHIRKPKMLEEYFGSKEAVLETVAFVLDDRDKVVEAWRNYGLPCWQVRLGTY